MKKVIIIGCPGAGKSTFARKLAAKTGLPLHYLDMIYHLPDRTVLHAPQFDKKLQELMAADEWILDGNYQRTMPARMKEADTVFFFDLPVEVCLEGAISRLGHERIDMPWHDDELAEDFRLWITNFPNFQLPLINRLLSEFTGTVYRFTDRAQADAFIADLPESSE